MIKRFLLLERNIDTALMDVNHPNAQVAKYISYSLLYHADPFMLSWIYILSPQLG